MPHITLNMDEKLYQQAKKAAKVAKKIVKKIISKAKKKI